MGKATKDTLEEEAQKQETTKEPVKLKRVRISAEISGDIAGRIKNAVYWTPGITMAGF